MLPAKSLKGKSSIYFSSSSILAEWLPHPSLRLRLHLLKLPEASWRRSLCLKIDRERELTEPSREPINEATHTEEEFLVAAIRNQIWDVQNGGI